MFLHTRYLDLHIYTVHIIQHSIPKKLLIPSDGLREFSCSRCALCCTICPLKHNVRVNVCDFVCMCNSYFCIYVQCVCVCVCCEQVCIVLCVFVCVRPCLPLKDRVVMSRMTVADVTYSIK